MANRSKTLYLTIVRHGQTDANKEKVLHGWTDTPLNATGLKQAQAAGKALKEVEFHLAFSSDLQRANKTCQLILEENQASDISAENIKKDKLLRERNFGILEGEIYDLVSEFQKNVFLHDLAPENGESGIEVENRGSEFLKSLAKLSEIDENTQSMLVVSHGGFMRRMFSVMFDEMNCGVSSNVTNVPDSKEGWKDKVDNTSFSRFEVGVCTENLTIKTMKCLELFNANHLNDLS